MRVNQTILLLITSFILTACASAPSVTINRSPAPQYPNVTANKPAPPPTQASDNTCSASNGKVGRSYVIRGVRYTPKREADYNMVGIASYYGKNHHGKMTANGETFNMYAMSAAHKTLPLPSCVRVTNLGTNKSIIVRINDRGPFIKGRIIDLSYAAAKELGFIGSGLTKVRVEVVN